MFTKETAATHGRAGGQRTVERHGADHMRAIGRRGFRTTVDRHWNGDTIAYLDYLQERALITIADYEIVLLIDFYREHRPDLLQED